MRLVYRSKWGGQIDLTDNEFAWLIDVQGLTLATTEIASVIIGGIDGDFVNNIQAQPRTIIMTLRIKEGVNVESAKRQLLSIIKLKQTGTLLWTQDNRTWSINGVIESIDMPRFVNGVSMQVSLHCEVPFWEDVEDVLSDISEAKNLHWFTTDPYDMLFFPQNGIPLGEYDTSRTRIAYNSGDVAVGMTIEVLAYKTVTNPIIRDQDGNSFGVGYESKPLIMFPGDRLVINTRSGEKSVTLNGISQLNKIKPFSTWLQFQAGENEFSINSDDLETDNMVFNLIYKQRYI